MLPQKKREQFSFDMQLDNEKETMESLRLGSHRCSFLDVIFSFSLKAGNSCIIYTIHAECGKNLAFCISNNNLLLLVIKRVLLRSNRIWLKFTQNISKNSFKHLVCIENIFKRMLK